MHTYFSENRLLAQYLPEASRPAGPEAQRQDSEVQKMLNTIEQKATEFMNSMTPEQKRQMDALAKEFMNNFGEIKSNFFDAVKQEIPQLGQYVNVGGTYGVNAPGIQWDPSQHVLQFDPNEFNLGQQRYQIDMGPHHHESIIVIGQDDETSLIDLYDHDETYEWNAGLDDGDYWIIDPEGMHQIDDIYAPTTNRYLLEGGVRTGTRSGLNDLRSQMPQQGLTAQQQSQMDRLRALRDADRPVYQPQFQPQYQPQYQAQPQPQPRPQPQPQPQLQPQPAPNPAPRPNPNPLPSGDGGVLRNPSMDQLFGPMPGNTIDRIGDDRFR